VRDIYVFEVQKFVLTTNQLNRVSRDLIKRQGFSYRGLEDWLPRDIEWRSQELKRLAVLQKEAGITDTDRTAIMAVAIKKADLILDEAEALQQESQEE